jgi:DNA-binding protein HU-beta
LAPSSACVKQWNFGKLVLSQRKAREGRNPATGEPIKIAAKTTLKFRVGKGMKDAAGVK